MQSNDLRSSIKRGLFNGILSSIIINAWIILSFYTDIHSVIFYLMGLPLTVTTYILLKNKTLKNFFISCLCSVIIFLLTSFIIIRIGIIQYVFNSLYDYGMSAGDGFGMMIIYEFNIIGSLIGSLIAAIVTILNKKRGEKRDEK